MIFQGYPDRADLAQGLAALIAQELAAASAARGRASLSVPGGTTPGPVFDALSRADLDWSRVSVVLNDERWVPPTHPRSNTRLLAERLFQHRAAAARLIPLYRDAPEPEPALSALAEGLRPHLPLDVLLLGMGADMHTASLFPGADLLAQALAPQAPILLPMRAEAAGEPRISLTAPALTSARAIHVLITGADKRRIIHQANGLSPATAPIALVLDKATVHWAE
ncbi:MAG: 6-phosphogluconolactonase [Paracoccaceae bacterium]